MEKTRTVDTPGRERDCGVYCRLVLKETETETETEREGEKVHFPNNVGFVLGVSTTRRRRRKRLGSSTLVFSFSSTRGAFAFSRRRRPLLASFPSLRVKRALFASLVTRTAPFQPPFFSIHAARCVLLFVVPTSPPLEFPKVPKRKNSHGINNWGGGWRNVTARARDEAREKKRLCVISITILGRGGSVIGVVVCATLL